MMAAFLHLVVAAAVTAVVDQTPELRLMSYNVQHCAGVASNVDMRVAQTYDITPIADAILRERPDFVGLNEVHCKTWRTGKVDYPAEKEYCIDYIAVDSAHAPACKVKEAYVTKNIIASDHNPLTVSLDVNRVGTGTPRNRCKTPLGHFEE